MSLISPTAINAAASTSATSSAVDNTMIASNFTTFLQLLTTQLKKSWIFWSPIPLSP